MDYQAILDKHKEEVATAIFLLQEDTEYQIVRTDALDRLKIQYLMESAHVIEQAALRAMAWVGDSMQTQSDEANEIINELKEALKVCHASLSTYGEHPIIDKQVKLSLFKTTQP